MGRAVNSRRLYGSGLSSGSSSHLLALSGMARSRESYEARSFVICLPLGVPRGGINPEAGFSNYFFLQQHVSIVPIWVER